jgi:DNA-binding XRE family transcriptional regulator
MKSCRETLLEEPSFGCEKSDQCTSYVSDPAAVPLLAYQHRLAFGRNFRRARVSHSLTLKAVAALSGVPENCIRAIEAAQCDPRLKAMTALAYVVECEVWTLLTLPNGAGE